MKKIFTIIVSLTFLVTFSQVERQKVIVEVGTGTWCPSCPAVVHIIDDLIDINADIAVIEYHNNDAYTNSDSQIRENYYDFPWFPTTYYDSNHIGFDDWATYSVHLANYNNRINAMSAFELNSSVSENLGDLSGTIDVSKISAYAVQNVVLHIVLTESNILQNWQGESELDFVERVMFPNGNGTLIDFSSDDNHTINFDFIINPNWNLENLEIVYFLQDNDTKEILQGDSTTEFNVAGAEDYTQNKPISFYPNPAKNQLFLNASNPELVKNIKIISVLGKEISKIPTYQNIINIEKLSQGIYMISYFVNNTKYTSKFVKQ